MTLRLRIATTNAPESHKRGLLRDRLTRARRMGRFSVRNHIDVRAIQEAGTYAEQVDAEQSERKVLWAAFNSFVNGRRVGNGVDVNRLRWKARLLDDVAVGDLHIAVVYVTHRRTGWAFKFYAVHKPTRRATNKALRPVIDATLREYTRRDDITDTPWVIAGDMNGTLNIGRQLGAHGPDHIRGSRHFSPVAQFVVDRPLLSDHHFLIADAEVDETA